jgi:three-Cys-motif partner protein
MTIGDDKQHFQDYREQTRIKHAILTAYLPAYYHILKRRNQNLVFIDGFAGPGSYTKAETGEVFDGSPLRALKLIAANKDFSQKVSTIFIEANPDLYSTLEETVRNFYRRNPQIREPRVSAWHLLTTR